jgi:hypothetical protein
MTSQLGPAGAGFKATPSKETNPAIGSPRVLGTAPAVVAIARQTISVGLGMLFNALLTGSSRLKWKGVFNAMARMDSLDCLVYWDFANLLVSIRGIYTS